ncbi:tetratricopeptide repeat protein [Panacibacter ginsenosidivorans]|uniref:Tetratricopeptide repeat protein n=1 Tax=Panacibacter ginsenosidivorans TaxID=1813871 RepID=A0A5B8V416_9BACT|nr:tetratricopeptide repeat protein [Panacibacter ginsenosidivorans]QEC66124.1 tetratricopeptide repeat protein [Panacibacter ginsenosidivorans]
MKIRPVHFKSLLLFFTVFLSGNIMSQSSQSMLVADSLYYAQNWNDARNIYERLLGDTSQNSIAWNRLGFSDYNIGNYDKALYCYAKALTFKPILPVKASVFSRMARIHALKNEKQKALTDIDSAFKAGYLNLSEMDSLTDFNNIRNEPGFVSLRQKIYAIAFPCMSDTHAREFDFWVGEWDVYVTGTTNYAGHSLVQVISGGCAILENWDSPSSTGKSINFIDPNTNKWKQSWAGSYANGVQEFINGEYRDSAMHFDFERKNAQGNKTMGRFIFYNQGPNQVRQFSESSADNGKTWTTNYDLTYKRRN